MRVETVKFEFSFCFCTAINSCVTETKKFEMKQIKIECWAKKVVFQKLKNLKEK